MHSIHPFSEELTLRASFQAGRSFLAETDRFLRENWETLRCCDVHDLYSDFFHELKVWRGNANNFTGLSEFLIFRFLMQQIGCEFQREQLNKDLFRFVSTTEEPPIMIAQGNPLSLPGHNRPRYPDIQVHCAGKLAAIIQIKLYVSGGVTEIRREIITLDEIHKHHPGVRALLIIFKRYAERSTILAQVEKSKKTRPWFDILMLEGETKKFKDCLQEYTNLEKSNSSARNGRCTT